MLSKNPLYKNVSKDKYNNRKIYISIYCSNTKEKNIYKRIRKQRFINGDCKKFPFLIDFNFNNIINENINK